MSCRFAPNWVALTYLLPLTDTACRRNRDLPLDAATQNFTLHLYATDRARAQPKRPDRHGQRRHLHQATQAARAATDDTEEMDDDEDDADYPWGSWGMGGRGHRASEETSLRQIKNVQGIEGSWTVTDCDATKSGDRSVFSFGGRRELNMAE